MGRVIPGAAPLVPREPEPAARDQRHPRERERVLSDEINAAEAGLFDMKQDLAFLARGLRGVVGERVG